MISDHAPTSLDINFPNHNRFVKPWRFNSNLLANDPLVDSLRSSIELFLEMNDNPDVVGVLQGIFKREDSGN